jgi:hypothetical protein
MTPRKATRRRMTRFAARSPMMMGPYLVTSWESESELEESLSARSTATFADCEVPSGEEDGSEVSALADDELEVPLDDGLEVPLDDGLEVPLDDGLEVPLDDGLEVPLGDELEVLLDVGRVKIRTRSAGEISGGLLASCRVRVRWKSLAASQALVCERNWTNGDVVLSPNEKTV